MERQISSATTKPVFTIGHSNHPIEKFLGLLQQHEIEVLADVRSFPFSKFATQFDQDSLHCTIKDAGLKYLFLGRELGGKPKEPSFYDDEGCVLYWKIAESSLFKDGIERLQMSIESCRVALLCSEENPSHCHRRLLVGRVMSNYGIAIQHIRGSGVVQSEQELETTTGTPVVQLDIFSQGSKDDRWESVQYDPPDAKRKSGARAGVGSPAFRGIL